MKNIKITACRSGFYIYGELENPYEEYYETIGQSIIVTGEYLHPDLVWRSSLAIPGKWGEVASYTTKDNAQEILECYTRLLEQKSNEISIEINTIFGKFYISRRKNDTTIIKDEDVEDVDDDDYEYLHKDMKWYKNTLSPDSDRKNPVYNAYFDTYKEAEALLNQYVKIVPYHYRRETINTTSRSDN